MESTLGEDDKFTDEVQDMIPTGCAILASTAMSGAICYGGIAVTETIKLWFTPRATFPLVGQTGTTAFGSNG